MRWSVGHAPWNCNKATACMHVPSNWIGENTFHFGKSHFICPYFRSVSRRYMHAHVRHVTHFPTFPVLFYPLFHFPSHVVHLHSQRFFDMLTVDFSDNLTGFDVKSVSKITLECQLTTLKEFSELTSLLLLLWLLLLLAMACSKLLLPRLLACVSTISHETIIFTPPFTDALLIPLLCVKVSRQII